MYSRNVYFHTCERISRVRCNEPRYTRVRTFSRIRFAVTPPVQLPGIVCITDHNCTIPFLVTYVACNCTNINLSNSTTGTQQLRKYIHEQCYPRIRITFSTFMFFYSRRRVPYGKTTRMCVRCYSPCILSQTLPVTGGSRGGFSHTAYKKLYIIFFVNAHLQSVCHTQRTRVMQKSLNRIILLYGCGKLRGHKFSNRGTFR